MGHFHVKRANGSWLFHCLSTSHREVRTKQEIARYHYVHVPNQWETTLQCNVASHWLSACTEWTLQRVFSISNKSFIVRSRKVSKARDRCWDFPNRSEIWQIMIPKYGLWLRGLLGPWCPREPDKLAKWHSLKVDWRLGSTDADAPAKFTDDMSI